MRKNLFLTVAAILPLLWIAKSDAQEITPPVLKKASFDSQGRLVTKVSNLLAEGCYIAIQGGLTSKTVNTDIISKQLTASDVKKGTITIQTKRRYYCKRRTLYVRAEQICFEPVSQTDSDAKAVPVPSGNVK